MVLVEKEMAIHSSSLAWEIPQTEELGRLQSMGSQRVGHDWATKSNKIVLGTLKCLRQKESAEFRVSQLVSQVGEWSTKWKRHSLSDLAVGTTRDLCVQLRLITSVWAWTSDMVARSFPQRQGQGGCITTRLLTRLPEKTKFSLSFTNSQILLKLMSIVSVMPSNHLILCHPLLLLPSIFPSIRVFFNESVLCIRWPKYWSFSFSISPSSEYSDTRLVRLEWRLTVVRTVMTLECC